MDTVNGLEWEEHESFTGDELDPDVSWHADVPGGHISILNRSTGYCGPWGSGLRDTETGFRDEDGKFWLAAGDFDIRVYADDTIPEAIRRIKANANICKGE